MDWFHCNRCFRQDAARFAVTSCGHVLCGACEGAGPCPVCAAACRYLAMDEQMRPQEKLFFKSPAAVALKRLAQVAQVWRFQRAQAHLLLAAHKDAARRAQAALEEARRALDARDRELEALRRENRELRRAQLSPCWRVGSRSGTPRPVGITSPAQTVTPQPRRQLSGQVVSRPTPPEPPPPRSTPVWQVGSAQRGAPTPPASSAAPSPGSAHGLTHRAAPPAPRTPLWVPWATPPPAAAIFPRR